MPSESAVVDFVGPGLCWVRTAWSLRGCFRSERKLSPLYVVFININTVEL